MRAKSGFTLVEILIVVVILGILAAIVIPQFTEASTEAKESSLCTDLQTLRSQIELYKIQHDDRPPRLADFVAQMTRKTDVDGTVNPDDGKYGPYLQKVPSNPFVPDAVRADDSGNGTIEAWGTAGSDTASWQYDENTGKIRPADSYDGDGDGAPDHANL